MKKTLIILLLIVSKSFSQNSSSVYGTSRPINIDMTQVISDTYQRKSSYSGNLNNVDRALFIYGGENNKVFLGCINCHNKDINSIWNKFSDYGSKFNNKSIWNDDGNFSGIHSDYSPFNKYAKNPPVLIDENGNFYGYFTVYQNYNNRTKYNLASFICDNWKEIKNNPNKFYSYIFQ